jgi:hypothetical protein
MSLNPAGTYALCTILPVIAAATVVTRMRVRLLKKAQFKADDWTACAGMVGNRLAHANSQLIHLWIQKNPSDSLIDCNVGSSGPHHNWNSQRSLRNTYASKSCDWSSRQDA